MHIVRGADAPQFELPGVRFTGLASPSRGSAELCAWQLTVAPGLNSPEPHTIDRDEIFVVVSGTIRLSPEGELAGPGDAVVVPAGEPIQVANPGAEPARVLVAIRAGFTAKAADGSDLGTPPWAL
jgi:mannose-6-phosphate isomerase-like protein (cupin superfamily)